MKLVLKVNAPNETGRSITLCPEPPFAGRVNVKLSLNPPDAAGLTELLKDSGEPRLGAPNANVAALAVAAANTIAAKNALFAKEKFS